jgi:hypothetical protein
MSAVGIPLVIYFTEEIKRVSGADLVAMCGAQAISIALTWLFGSGDTCSRLYVFKQRITALPPVVAASSSITYIARKLAMGFTDKVTFGIIKYIIGCALAAPN